MKSSVIRIFAACFAVSTTGVLVLSLILPLFSRSGAAQLRAQRARVSQIVSAGLAFHAGSRWLRHPEASEPWAPFQDNINMMDSDPAGSWTIAPNAAQLHAVSTHARLLRRAGQ